VFEKVLVLTDFSAYGNKFLEYIGSLPEVKEVVILNVVTKDPRSKDWDPAAKIEDAEKKLAKAKKLIKATGVEVKTRAVPAPDSEMPSEISEIIDQVASEEKVQLVAIGARGKSAIQDILLGSLARSILRHSDKHLLIMRYKMQGSSGRPSAAIGTAGVAEPPKEPEMLDKFGSGIFSKVLIPTDFSAPAEEVISSIGRRVGVGEVVLLHVVSKGESEEEVRNSVHEATQRLGVMCRELTKDGIPAKVRIAVGSPIEAIQSVAEEEDVSMIAMSSVGENAMRVGRIGDITYGVASTAKRPVLVMRLKVKYNFAF